MSEISNKKYIMSIRCIDLKKSAPGSQKRECIRCGELAWVSPAPQNQKSDGVICQKCVTSEEMKEVVFILKPEVIEEVLRVKSSGDYGYGM
jgi:hypothetical protein